MKTLSILAIFSSLFFTSTSFAQAQSSNTVNGKATYRVQFMNLWNKKDHLAFPSNAHFSPIVAVTHKSNYRLFRIGDFTRPALEPLAELGRTDGIQKEIMMAKSVNRVQSAHLGNNFFPEKKGDMISFDIEVSASHPYLSLVSMIAPSPDWVVGLDSITLYNKGHFSRGGRMNLYAINAGTEDGDIGGNFSINNQPSNPQRPISFLTRRTGLMAPFAAVKITRVK